MRDQDSLRSSRVGAASDDAVADAAAAAALLLGASSPRPPASADAAGRLSRESAGLANDGGEDGAEGRAAAGAAADPSLILSCARSRGPFVSFARSGGSWSLSLSGRELWL